MDNIRRTKIDLRVLVQHMSVLASIPPDISVGELVNLLRGDDKVFATDGKELLVLDPDDPDPYADGSIPPSVSSFSHWGLEDKSLDALVEAFSNVEKLHYWQQSEAIEGLFKSVSVNRPDVNLRVFYNSEDEYTEVYTGDTRLLLLYGEEVYEDLKLVLHPSVFENTEDQSTVKVDHPVHGWVDIEKSIALLEDPDRQSYLRKFSSLPKFVKIQTLFEVYYAQADDPKGFYYRHGRDGIGIYLTYHGVDVVSYKIANVSWPHLRKAKEKGTPGRGAPNPDMTKYRVSGPLWRGIREVVPDKGNSFWPLVRLSDNHRDPFRGTVK